MFSMLKSKKPMGRPAKKFGTKQTYKGLAITPEAHAKIVSIAQRREATIIDTVNQLVGV